MIATIGEALVDMIEQADGRYQPCMGGSVFNISLALARQDIPVTYLNPLSVDHFGRRFHALLSENGAVLGKRTASACPTSLAIVNMDAQGLPRYAFHRQGVADRDIGATALAASFPPTMRVLHTGGLALVPEDMTKMLAVIGAARARHTLISIDANVRLMAVAERAPYIDGIRRAIAQAHILKVSEEDLDALGLGLADFAATLFHESSLELIALTCGAQGASLLTRRGRASTVAPTGLRVADTVGAGDCFHAGLLAYLHRANRLSMPADVAGLDDATMSVALRHAVASASLNIMKIGCDPATWEQLVAFKATLD